MCSLYTRNNFLAKQKLKLAVKIITKVVLNILLVFFSKLKVLKNLYCLVNFEILATLGMITRSSSGLPGKVPLCKGVPVFNPIFKATASQILISSGSTSGEVPLCKGGNNLPFEWNLAYS